jgi:hypothetical protein
MRETPGHHAVATLEEQDTLLNLAELLFEFFADVGAMYFIQRRLAEKFFPQ